MCIVCHLVKANRCASKSQGVWYTRNWQSVQTDRCCRKKRPAFSLFQATFTIAYNQTLQIGYHIPGTRGTCSCRILGSIDVKRVSARRKLLIVWALVARLAARDFFKINWKTPSCAKFPRVLLPLLLVYNSFLLISQQD